MVVINCVRVPVAFIALLTLFVVTSGAFGADHNLGNETFNTVQSEPARTGPDDPNLLAPVLPGDSKFWVPPEDRTACLESSWNTELTIERRVEGWERRNPALQFIQDNSDNLGSAINNKDFRIGEYVKDVVNAASSRAYTEMDWGFSGGGSPGFMSSLILISMSYTVSLFDQNNVWTQSQRNSVVKWGNILERNLEDRRSYSSMDSYAGFAASRMAWGAVTQQPSIFQYGLKDFHRVAGHIKDNGLIETNLRDNNESVQFLVLAAEVATQNGIPAYDFKYGGKTIVDAVMSHTKHSHINPRRKWTESEGSTPMSYVRRSGFVTHIAWAPVFISRFPDHPASQGLRELVARARGVAISGTSMGGNTECLWGPRG